jgi:diguanylate cyclase (GGDEF)-like protein
VPIARASTGLLVGIAALGGWLTLRWVQGVAPRTEIMNRGAMCAYMLFGTAALVAWFGYAMGRIEERLRRANIRLRALATHDQLTGLANARVFHRELPRLVSLARRAHIRLSLVLLDLDRFKDLNDSFGHAAGDAALAAVGRALGEGRRREDVAARIGGEELALILPGVDAAGAHAVAQRVLATIRSIAIERAPQATVTASAGIASLGDNDDADALFVRSDRALYAAKHAGRDQVVCG